MIFLSKLFIYVLFFTVNIESTIMIYKYIIKNNKIKTSNYSFYGYLVILINKNMRLKHSVFAVYSACCLKLLNKHTNESIFSTTWDNG